MNQNEKMMFTGIAMSRNNEVTLRWQRNAMFMLIHSTGFSFIGLHPPTPIFMIIISVVGMTLGLFWVLINWRTQQWIRFWNQRLEEMEQDAEDVLRVRIYSSVGFKKVDSDFPTFHQILMTFSILAPAGWFGVLTYAWIH